MVNAFIKIALAAYLFCGIISIFDAMGMGPGNTQPEVNVNDTMWYTITDTGELKATNAVNGQTESQTASLNILADFLWNTVYIKGVLDQFCNNQWPYTLFTALAQATIYIITSIGLVSWILNRTGVV
jgi:hypothetical protein